MKRIILALAVFLSTPAFAQIVGTYYADWSLHPARSGAVTIAPSQFTALSAFNLVVEFGDGNVSSSPPYYTVVGGGSDSTRYRYSDFYNPDGNTGVGGVLWQDVLGNAVHSHGGKYLITVQAVSPSALISIQNDAAKTEVFCTNVAQYAKRRGFDGVEVDEEYWSTSPPQFVRESPYPKTGLSWAYGNQDRARAPKLRSKSSLKATAGSVNLARFYSTLRRKMDEAFTQTRGIIVLTCQRTDMSTYSLVNKSDVDYVFFMLYDYQWVWSTSASAAVAYYFAPLNTPAGGANTNGTSVASDGPAKWAASGWPKAKLVFGFPAYGFMFRGANQLWQSYGAASNASELVSSSIATALSSGGVQGWDAVAQAPYVSGTASKAFSVRTTSGGSFSISNGQKFFISFENQQSLQAKYDYVKAGGYGGIFLYDVGGDVSGTQTPLHTALAAISSGATPPPPPPPPPVKATGTLTPTTVSLPAGGGSINYTWTSQNATSVTFRGQAVALSGTQTVEMSQSGSNILVTSGTGGSTAYTSVVTVAATPPPPSGQFTAADTLRAYNSGMTFGYSGGFRAGVASVILPAPVIITVHDTVSAPIDSLKVTRQFLKDR
jgi:GH18 family chitinase